MGVKKVFNKDGTTTWFYDFSIRGVRYRGAIPEARNKDQAKQAETRERNSVFDGKYGSRRVRQPKLKDFVRDTLLPWAEVNRQSWSKDASRLKPILEFFGEKRLDDISSFLIEKYKTKRKTTPIIRVMADGAAVSKPRSVATVNRELSLLSRIFSIARMLNPCSEVKKLPGEQPRTRYLLLEEEDRLMSALDSKPILRSIVVLALNTGMRRGEILRLKWEHVDFHKGEIKATHTKGHRDRFIPMNAKTREELLTLQASSKSLFLFPGRKEGASLSDIKRPFNAACDRAGIKDFRFHDLRHTFGTRAADAGASLRNIADVMGHANIHTTMRYAHATDQGRRRVVDAVNIEPKRAGQVSVKWKVGLGDDQAANR